MKNLSFYNKAHIFVSAIRILEYKNEGLPPSPEDISVFLKTSVEEILLITRKLQDQGIIKTIEKNQSLKLSVNDHTLIESIPKETTSPLDDQLKEFQEKQKNKSKEIEEFQKKQKEKQQELFEKLNQDLKEKTEKV